MKALNEKAMLVKLTMRRANLTRRDQVAETMIQMQLDDASLVVNSKLFRDKANPVNTIMSKASEVYTFHKNNTLPYMDKGPRILPIAQYEDYTSKMRERIQHIDSLIQRHMTDYDKYVQQDIAYRSQNKSQARAKVEDYPTADEFATRMGFDLRFMPLPDKRHFLFDLDEADLQAFEESMSIAERTARDDAVKRMLVPLQHLVEKLNTPIGAEGHIFRDSAVENVVEGIELAKKLCMDESPEIQSLTKALNEEVSKYVTNLSWLRESPPVREQAAKKLSDIAAQMGAFMGVPQ